MKHRERLAQETRKVVADAARLVFADHGYVQTTVGVIAEASGVPQQTIYSSFGSKPEILEEIRRRWIEESDVAALHAAAMALTSPAERLARAAHWTRRQFELGHDVITVYQEAARADQRAAEAWKAALTFREAAIRRLIEPMSPDLDAGVSTDWAVDLYVAITVPEIYGELVIARGWTPEAYEEWLTSALTAELLA